MKKHLPILAFCFWGIACSPETPATDQKILDQIRARSGIQFSPGAEVLNHNDAGQGGGGAQEWTIASSAEIPLPIFNNGYLRTNSASVDLQKRAQLFYARLPQESLTSVDELHSHWETSNFVYAATLLKTGKGNYLLLIEFRK